MAIIRNRMPFGNYYSDTEAQIRTQLASQFSASSLASSTTVYNTLYGLVMAQYGTAAIHVPLEKLAF